MMNTPTEKIHAQVQDQYTRAIQTPKDGVVAQTGTARFANYDAETLNSVPEDVVASSFGCGNPLAFGEIQNGDVVLDLGSGAGFDLLIAAPKVGSTGKIIGIDMTDAMLDRARENIRRSGFTNIEVRKGLIENLPVEDASVDWVISNCVINLSPEKDKVFREIFRVLKPGGRMLVSDIVANDLPWWVRKSVSLYAACVGGAISEAEYLRQISAAGLNSASAKERMVYDKDMVLSLAMDMLPEAAQKATLFGKSIAQGSFGVVLPAITGKIASVKFYAQKPQI